MGREDLLEGRKWQKKLFFPLKICLNHSYCNPLSNCRCKCLWQVLSMRWNSTKTPSIKHSISWLEFGGKMTRVTQINGTLAALKKQKNHRLLSLLHPGRFCVCKEGQFNFRHIPRPFSSSCGVSSRWNFKGTFGNGHVIMDVNMDEPFLVKGRLCLLLLSCRIDK